MTLQQLPPPNVDYFEFNQDIKGGLRPPLFTRDVSTSSKIGHLVDFNLVKQ